MSGLECGASAFADVIAIPGGNFYRDVAFDDGLAAETGPESEAGGHVETIELVVVGFGQVLVAVDYDDVASGAGATSSAGMLEVNVEIEGDIENGLAFSVVVVGKLSGFELD